MMRFSRDNHVQVVRSSSCCRPLSRPAWTIAAVAALTASWAPAHAQTRPSGVYAATVQVAGTQMQDTTERVT